MNYYKDTFQHGGISLEEVIIPIIKMRSKTTEEKGGYLRMISTIRYKR